MQLGRAQPLRTASQLKQNTGVTCHSSLFIPYKTHLILSGLHDFAKVASKDFNLYLIRQLEGEKPIINSITTLEYPQFPFLSSILNNNQTNATVSHASQYYTFCPVFKNNYMYTNNFSYAGSIHWARHPI